jgi:hypothetical protein
MFDTREILKPAIFVCSLLLLTIAVACTAKKTSSTNNQSNAATPTPATTTTPAMPAPATPQAGSLNPGEASGSCTAKGETVTLKYAYAGRGVRFGQESVIVLVTDKPIPPEALAEEFKSQTMFYDEKIRGLEYVFSKESFWVRFHPSQYQESSSLLKDYSVENDIVKGSDEDKGDVTDGKYSRSVKFVAKIQ